MTQIKVMFGLFVLIGLLLVGCENTDEIFRPFNTNNESSQKERDFSDTHPVISKGAVYTMTNSSSVNEVLVFQRTSKGQLEFAGSYGTKGRGMGDGIDALASQGSIVLSRDFSPKDSWIGSPKKNHIGSQRWLFVVNAGSNSISVFAASGGGLQLRDIAGSGGGIPVSVTYHNHLLYVLNRSSRSDVNVAIHTRSNINGYKVDGNGRLEEISGSSKPLSSYGETEAAGIKFRPDGKMLVVTEKEANVIDIFLVRSDGLTSRAISYKSSGLTPFGFDFDKSGRLIIAETFNSEPNQSAASLYELGSNGDLQMISTSVSTKQTGGSRVVMTRDGKYAYIANTQSGTISGFRITATGQLEPIHAQSFNSENTRPIDPQSNESAVNRYTQSVVAVLDEGSLPTDMALSDGDRFLYVLAPGAETIYAFEVQRDGTLKPLPMDSDGLLSGISGVQGLAAY